MKLGTIPPTPCQWTPHCNGPPPPSKEETWPPSQWTPPPAFKRRIIYPPIFFREVTQKLALLGFLVLHPLSMDPPFERRNVAWAIDRGGGNGMNQVILMV